MLMDEVIVRLFLIGINRNKRDSHYSTSDGAILILLKVNNSMIKKNSCKNYKI